MKKLNINFQINFTNRAIYTFIALAVFLVIGVTVFAFGTSNPSTFGHSAGELDLSGGIDGDVVFRGNVDVIGGLNVTQGLGVTGNLDVVGTINTQNLLINGQPPESGEGGGGGFPSGVITGTGDSISGSTSKSVNLNSYPEAKYIKFGVSCPHVLKYKSRSNTYSLLIASVSLEFFDSNGASITSGNLCGNYFVPIPLQSSSFKVVTTRSGGAIASANWELWTAG